METIELIRSARRQPHQGDHQYQELRTDTFTLLRGVAGAWRRDHSPAIRWRGSGNDRVWVCSNPEQGTAVHAVKAYSRKTHHRPQACISKIAEPNFLCRTDLQFFRLRPCGQIRDCRTSKVKSIFPTTGAFERNCCPDRICELHTSNTAWRNIKEHASFLADYSLVGLVNASAVACGHAHRHRQRNRVHADQLRLSSPEADVPGQFSGRHSGPSFRFRCSCRALACSSSDLLASTCTMCSLTREVLLVVVAERINFEDQGEDRVTMVTGVGRRNPKIRDERQRGRAALNEN